MELKGQVSIKVACLVRQSHGRAAASLLGSSAGAVKEPGHFEVRKSANQVSGTQLA